MRFLHLRESGLSWKALREKLQGNRKRALAALFCVLALALLAASEWLPKRTETAQDPQLAAQQYASALEERLETLLSSIDGAGRTQVLVTLRSGEETVWARNEKADSTDDAQQTRAQSERTYVLVRSGSAETGLPLKIVSPQVSGVAVVCEGAADPQVRQNITQTLTSALGIGAGHVSVVPMQTERK